MGFGKGKLTTIHDRVNFYKDVYDDSGVHFEREGNKVSLVTGKGIVFIDKLTVYSEDAFNHAFDTYKPRQDCLNSNQQVVLEWLKEAQSRSVWSSPLGSLYGTIREHELTIRRLDTVQQFQVLAAFAEWGLSHAEE
ncbi:hypothetical protein KQI33_14890 [Enterococcus devriesei]|uniref:hypothetical protein n=1 Tax=Enterococcus devriesei TaxID=319970 RepID=UPI001C11FA0D|nr:hypothetical protein [Enterococcus devriesei]MBU5366666.1 hypothetical protein [Enterococcus devriesei]